MSTAARRLACGMLNMGQVNRRKGGVLTSGIVDSAALSGIFSNKTPAAAIKQLDDILSTPQKTSATTAIPAAAVRGVVTYYANSLTGLSAEAKASLDDITTVFVASGTNVNGVLTLNASTWASVDGILLLPSRVTFKIAGINNVTYFSSGSVMTVTGGLYSGTYDAGSEGVSVPVIYPTGTVSIRFYGSSSPALTCPEGPVFIATTAPETTAPETTTETTTDPTITYAPTTMVPVSTTASGTTTAAPASTTASGNTTGAPVSTTASGTTTAAPGGTTVPGSTTAAASTTAAPGTTSATTALP